MSLKQKLICVLGSGIWGTAIATQINRKHGSCTIFTKTQATFESINLRHSNKGVNLPSSIDAEIDFTKLAEYQNIVLAAPSYALHELIDTFVGNNLPKTINLIIATKGLDVKKSQLISQSIQDALGNPVMILSGPSFADEVINNEFTAISLAAQDFQDANKIADLLSTPKFVVVPSSDVVGLQLSGCMKNVIAILVGMLKSLSYGDNLCSIVISKGILEIKTLAKVLNQNIDMFDYGSNLAIIGDTTLSCSSIKSRNMSFGMQLATGLTAPGNLVEGKLAIQTLLRIAYAHNVSLPVIELASRCINNPLAAKQIIDECDALIIN